MFRENREFCLFQAERVCFVHCRINFTKLFSPRSWSRWSIVGRSRSRGSRRQTARLRSRAPEAEKQVTDTTEIGYVLARTDDKRRRKFGRINLTIDETNTFWVKGRIFFRLQEANLSRKNQESCFLQPNAFVSLVVIGSIQPNFFAD